MDKNKWALVQKIFVKSKASDDLMRNELNRILNKISSMERGLLGDASIKMCKSSRYNHERDLLSANTRIERISLFKLNNSNVFAIGVCERNHLIPAMLRLTFTYELHRDM